MKFLRNPIFVGALAALAIGAAAWNVFRPALARRQAARASGPPAPPAATQATPAGAMAGPSATNATPTRPIDLAHVSGRLLEWLQAPRRDPFEAFVPTALPPQGPRAADVLSIKAIWRQTGVQLAVVNNQVLGEGDQILHYRLERIEGDVLWVRGTNGAERVEYRSPGGTAAAPGPTSAPSPTSPTPGQPT